GSLPEMEVVPSREPEPQPAAAAPPQDTSADKIQEIQFYISQEMWDAAKKAILDLTEIAPDAPEITQFISAVSAGQARAARASAPPAHAAPVAAALSEMPVPEPPVHEAAVAAPLVPEMPVHLAPEPAARFAAVEMAQASPAPALEEFAVEVEGKPSDVAQPVAMMATPEVHPP